MPARFHFSLEPVLELRRIREREAMVRVAEVERERLALEGRIRTLTSDADRARTELRDCLSGPSRQMSLRGVGLQANTMFSLHGQTHAGALALAGVLRRLEMARAALLKASTDRKAVERLRERRFDEWRHANARAQSRADDEIASVASARTLAVEANAASAKHESESLEIAAAERNWQ